MSRAEPASSATTVPAATSSPSAACELPFDRGLHFVDDDRHGAQAGDDARLAGDDRRPALRIGADEGDGRPIVLAAEVFAHGEPDELPQVVFEGGVPIELVEVWAKALGVRCQVRCWSMSSWSVILKKKWRSAPPGVDRRPHARDPGV